MVRNLAIMILALIGFSTTMSCSGGDSNSDLDENLAVDISLTVEGQGAGQGILGGIYAGQFYRVDTLRFNEDGELEIERENPLPKGLYYILLPEDPQNILMLLGDDQKFRMHTGIADVVANMQVEGSEDNALFYKNQQFEREWQQRYEQAGSEEEKEQLVRERRAEIDKLQEEHPESMFTKFKVAGQDPLLADLQKPGEEYNEQRLVYRYRNQYWDNVDFTQDWLIRTPVYQNKLQKFIERAVPQNADSLIKYADDLTRRSMASDSLFRHTANWIGKKYKQPEFMGGDAVYVHMIENFFTPELAFWSTDSEVRALQQDAAVRKNSLPGARAENIVAEGTDGGQVELMDIQKDYVVLYMYSYTCDNCKKETPRLVKFHREWQNKGVGVYALSMDDDRQQWKDYIESNGMQGFVNAIDPDFESGYNFKYHADITPEIYVIGPDRTIIAKDLKAEQIPTVIERHRAGEEI